MSETKDDSKTYTDATPVPSGGSRWDKDPKAILVEVTNVDSSTAKPEQLIKIIKNKKE